MKKIISTGVVLDIDNIDTDQIIPARFLKATHQKGFGKHLFHNWRYLEDGTPNPDFAFQQYASGSRILLAGNNFGCGSSREHAAWALADYGIQAVISTQFADIFKGNALNNGILPIEVTGEELKAIAWFVNNHRDGLIHIDLSKQELSLDSHGYSLRKHFSIDPLKKEFLIAGTTELEYLINMRTEISAFATTHTS